MTIAMLILGVAVLGISGVQDEQKLRESAAQIESTARDSLLKAVAEHRPVQIDIAGGIQGANGNVEVRRYGEKSFRKPDQGEFWEFTFSTVGAWSYHDNFDVERTGVVVVQ